MREPGIMAERRDDFEENEDFGDEEDILDLHMPKDSAAKRGGGAKQIGKKRNRGRRGRDKTRFRQSWTFSFISYCCRSATGFSNCSLSQDVLSSCLALCVSFSLRSLFKTFWTVSKSRKLFLRLVVCCEDLWLHVLVITSFWKFNQEHEKRIRIAMTLCCL